MRIRLAGYVVVLGLWVSGCTAPTAAPAPGTPVRAPAAPGVPEQANVVPSTAAPQVPNSASLHAQALSKLNAGDVAAAATLLEQAVLAERNSAALHNDLAYAYLLLGKADDAWKEASMARYQAQEAKQNDLFLFATYNAADAAARLGRYTNAIALLTEYIGMEPNRVEPHLLLARAYLGAGWTEEARQAASAALKVQPDQSEAAFVAQGKVPEGWVLNYADPQKGALWSGLVDGRQVFLHAHDQREWTEKNSWCGAAEGQVGHGGTYAWYVEPAPGQAPVRQPLTLTSQWAEGRPVSFNGGMPTVTTLELRGRTFLVLWQPINCNFKEMQVFGWDESANQLVQYGFQFQGETEPTFWPGISGAPTAEGEYLKTQSYNNAKGEWTVRTWELRGNTFVNTANTTK